MNRQERRNLEKRVRKGGATAEEAKSYVKTINNADAIRVGGAGTPSPPKKFEEGDKVRLNMERIKSRKNYERMADAYKEFVDASTDMVFTAHVERENMISLVEEPEWLFWSGDLDKVENET